MFCFVFDWYYDLIISPMSLMKAGWFAVLNTQQARLLIFPEKKKMVLCILHLHILASSQCIVFKLHSIMFFLFVMGW